MTERSPGPSKQQDSRIAPAAVDDTARAVIDTLSAAGYVAFLNGGCVRDLLMGQAPKDWDIVTDAGPDEVTGLFEHTIPVGAQFGIVRVRIEDREFEVARFRREGPYSDGRRPDHVDLAGPRQDAQRRDFTINGMFYDPIQDRVIEKGPGAGEVVRPPDVPGGHTAGATVDGGPPG